ncbi:thiamine diphosphokinase [Mucilaginibacter sp. KACC 22773]|jgi:thiamine pyrophosphokinase|uniref:thiamine diphosphokinase n=1 Tax=Mucilaginibacter sp. KACC 22773 TaxID=3025671 RepID=UPI002366E2C8|nr:thiamine diphosphokinase [Mucilaginibacter sp. KACC 22773]WDF78356.1 thiamine diphosphokinase [Mucilaginibacter sp. KACC 22773]
MSSHHIVREKQEPALLVLGIDNFEEELLGQLLEWSPTVITTPDTAEKLNSFGIKIDWIITDDDGAVFTQSDVRLIAAGNSNITQAALKFLTINNYPAVNVITDDLELSDFLPYADKINLVIFNARQKIYPVTSGFSKWKPADEQIELLSPTRALKYSGLLDKGQNRYQTTVDGFFTLNFDEPFLLIAETLN